MDNGNAHRRRASEALAKFLRYLAELESALARREAMSITALLRKRTATHLPREVREELLMLSRAPRESLRAPIQFLRFQHRMTQLARSGEGLPTAQTELPFESRLDAGSIRRRPAASDPIAAPEANDDATDHSSDDDDDDALRLA
ncbi:MAG TPA: hypothetical protein VIP11_04640, partial [Gemmatimonadaceae bacterium]